MKKVALFLADGFEEIEALTPVDVLRRANIEVTTISISTTTHVTGAHQINVIADTTFDQPDYSTFDAIILPGGMPGTNHLKAHQELNKLLVRHAKEGKLIGAICAAPLILGELNLLQTKNVVCYPGFEKHLKGANILNETIAKDKNLVTANGAGAAMLFALNLVEELLDQTTANKLAEKMLFVR